MLEEALEKDGKICGDEPKAVIRKACDVLARGRQAECRPEK